MTNTAERCWALIDGNPCEGRAGHGGTHRAVTMTGTQLHEAQAKAWDEGYERAADTCPYSAPHHAAHGNPYRAD